MRNYSSRKKVLAAPSGFDTVINTVACNFTGREYNRVLSKYIIDDLLDALSAEDATEFTDRLYMDTDYGYRHRS